MYLFNYVTKIYPFSSLQMNIYFYTVKEIEANQELLVWYCREFAERLGLPLIPEQFCSSLVAASKRLF